MHEIIKRPITIIVITRECFSGGPDCRSVHEVVEVDGKVGVHIGK